MVISRRIDIGEFTIRIKRRIRTERHTKRRTKDVLKAVLKGALKTALTTVAGVSAYPSEESEHAINPPMKVRRELCT